MAEHGQVEYTTAQGNDLPAHVTMYDRFVHWIVVGGAHAANVVLGLAIGGVAGHWLVAFAIFVVATIVAFHGFLSGARMPSIVMVIISLITLALASGG
ncbi:MAG: aa3-type cytochrome c oxidase subunit IV [Alphaproteobacteria bacterium]|nr:MAG: aa3-type cytochrome c oxidase subunit IV [Alphaproteobacteria bacterium]